MIARMFLGLVVFLFCAASCHKTPSNMASIVEVKQEKGAYNFYVNDELFTIKGVGFNYEYKADFEELSQTGANTIRTWSTQYADTILKAAKKNDLMVAMGIHIGKELWGFDYNDSSAVAYQMERVKKTINTYKNDPSILCWVVGNELNLLFEDDGVTLKDVNPKVYDALSDIVDYIHKVDPNHPVTTTFAGVIEPHLKTGLNKVPQLDFVSVQVYADLLNVEASMKKTGIDKPYLVTEFGAKGFWEMPKTSWNREIEEPSGPKVDGIIKRMKTGIFNNTSGKCLGGFAFVWGQKHERTPTWYGMHHEDGKKTAYLDELTNLWTGAYPKNRAPRVDSLKLNNLNAIDNIYLKPNTSYVANVAVSYPNPERLTYKWEIAQEVTRRSQGGEKEQKPPRMEVNILNNSEGMFEFVTPDKEGAYRILCYVYDHTDKAGNANIPFYIKK